MPFRWFLLPSFFGAAVFVFAGFPVPSAAQTGCLSAQRNIVSGVLVAQTQISPTGSQQRRYFVRLAREACVAVVTPDGRRGLHTRVRQIQLTGSYDPARARALTNKPVTIGARGFYQQSTAWHVTKTLVDTLWIRPTTPRYRGSDSLVELRDDQYGVLIAVPYRVFRRTVAAPRKSETKLVSRDGALSVYFFARNRTPKARIAGYYRRALRGHRGASFTYRRLTRRFFVLSGRWADGRSFYRVGATFVVRGDRTKAGDPAYAGFVVRWPAARDADITPHIPKMFQSFWDSVQ